MEKLDSAHLKGSYKRTQTVALWEAKFYLPWQAAVPQRLINCGAAVEEPQ